MVAEPVEGPGHHDLLLVPAGELAREARRVGRLHAERLDPPGDGACLVELAGVAQVAEDQVVAHRSVEQEAIDLPERAHKAVNHLSELRAMMAGICDLVSRDPDADNPTALETTFKHLRELTRIMETEMHEAVLSCTRARRQMLAGILTPRPTLH